MARRRRGFIGNLISTDLRVAVFYILVGALIMLFATGSEEGRDRIFGLLAKIGFSSSSTDSPTQQPVYQPGDLISGQTYQVERVVDGDTIRLVGYKDAVRLIGADTPETVHPDKPPQPFGKEATEFTKNFFTGGTVRIETDGPPRDKYGRHLAHLWVGDRELGVELVRNGLAEAMTDYRFSQEAKDRLTVAQTQARSEGRGIWTIRQ